MKGSLPLVFLMAAMNAYQTIMFGYLLVLQEDHAGVGNTRTVAASVCATVSAEEQRHVSDQKHWHKAIDDYFVLSVEDRCTPNMQRQQTASSRHKQLIPLIYWG